MNTLKAGRMDQQIEADCVYQLCLGFALQAGCSNDTQSITQFLSAFV